MRKKRVTPWILLAVVLIFISFFISCSYLKPLYPYIPWYKPWRPKYSTEVAELISNKETVLLGKTEYVVTFDKNEEIHFIPVLEYVASLKKKPHLLEKAKRSTKEKILLASSTEKLNKRVVIFDFFDRTHFPENRFGKLAASFLRKKIIRIKKGIILLNHELIGGKYKNWKKEGKKESFLKYMSCDALVFGSISGPYISVTKSILNKGEESAIALLQVEVRVVDGITGETFATIKASNPVSKTKQEGAFSEEKAYLKALKLTIDQLYPLLKRKINALQWHARIISITKQKVYIDAGRRSGVTIGEIFDVLPSEDEKKTKSIKGEIQISELFGIDGAAGKVIKGKKIKVLDIIKPKPTF
ncbi:MAG: hypothetical protein JRI44_07305 [Deltaproteobacteria bacterium]|nr:hypothetical protein [Deltaproteobacteria bacterium]